MHQYIVIIYSLATWDPILILGNNQLDSLFHIFIYLFHVSTGFERHSAHNQEIELC